MMRLNYVTFLAALLTGSAMANNDSNVTTSTTTTTTTTTTTLKVNSTNTTKTNTTKSNTNTTNTTTTEKPKLRVTIAAVTVEIDFTVVNDQAKKDKAAEAVYKGVEKEACVKVAGFASVAECKAGKNGKSGKLFAKFDAQFGMLTDTTMSTGYDDARRMLRGLSAARSLAATSTSNDFKFVLTVPDAAAATSAKTVMNTELAKATVFSQATLKTAIDAEWDTAALGTAPTVTFSKPTNMGAEDVQSGAGGSSSTSAAASVSVFGTSVTFLVSSFLLGMM